MWEDEANKQGGKLTISLKKDNANLVWEELTIAFIGGLFPEKIREELCGIVVSVRRELTYLQVWIRNSQDAEIIKEIE